MIEKGDTGVRGGYLNPLSEYQWMGWKQNLLRRDEANKEAS